MTDWEYIEWRLDQAESGKNKIGNILVALSFLAGLVEKQNQRIEALERMCKENNDTAK